MNSGASVESGSIDRLRAGGPAVTVCMGLAFLVITSTGDAARSQSTYANTDTRHPEAEREFHVAAPAPGLVGYWPFNEGSGGTARDCSGHGNDGTIYGASWIAGLQGFALNYDGVNDCVVCDNTVGDEFTLQAWIWTAAESLHGPHAFDGNAILWADYFGIQWDDWSLAVLNDRAAFTTGNPDTTVIGTTPVNDGQWHQIVAVRKRGAYKRLFVDAVLDGEGPTNGQLLADQLVMCMGGNTIDHRYLRGLIDEVRLYDRELSLAEIEQLYHHPPGFYPGDLNCDSATDSCDIDAFVMALADPRGYPTAFPCCKRILADCSADGAVNVFDIDPFVALLTGASVHLACCYEAESPAYCVDAVELTACVAGGGRWDMHAALCAELAPPCGQRYGACCDPSDGACQDEVPRPDCGALWYLRTRCSELDPPCGNPGACCHDLAAACADGVLAAACAGRHSRGTCADLSPACGTVCTHRVDLYESWYDGWNGNTLDVYVDGVLVLDDITLPGGLGPLSFEFMAGTGSAIHTVYNAISGLQHPYYRILDGFGTLIIQDGGSHVPPTGVTVYGRCAAAQGACCDVLTGLCDDNVSVFDCSTWFYEGAQCEELSPPCGNPGACCDDEITGECVDYVPELLCATRFAAGTLCDDLTPVCVVPWIPCEDGLIIAPGSWSGTTCGMGDHCALRAGADITVRVTIPTGGNWSFSLCGGSPLWDTYMFLGSDCCTSAWYDDDGCGSVLSLIQRPALPAGDYYVDIEPYSSSNCNSVTLTVGTY